MARDPWETASLLLIVAGSISLGAGMVLAFRKASPLDALNDPLLRPLGTPYQSFRRDALGTTAIEVRRYESELDAHSLYRHLDGRLRSAGFTGNTKVWPRQGRTLWQTPDGRYQVTAYPSIRPDRKGSRSRVRATGPGRNELDFNDWAP